MHRQSRTDHSSPRAILRSPGPRHVPTLHGDPTPHSVAKPHRWHSLGLLCVATLTVPLAWAALAGTPVRAGPADSAGRNAPLVPLATVTPTQVNPIPNNPLSLPAATTPEPCGAFTQVNDRAFGLTGAGGFGDEDGFEVGDYAGQLYIGMEADNALGARLWRTKPGEVIATSQSDWEEVSSVGGVPAFGDSDNNDHIDSIQGFAGNIYASTALTSGDPAPDGTQLWRSATGDANSWTKVNTIGGLDGFGDVNNVNFKDMVVVNVAGTDTLCGGTGNDFGTEIWCSSDGGSGTWIQENLDGFGQPNTARDILTGSSTDYGGRLYFGTSRFNLITFAQLPGAVWRTLDTSVTPWTWEEVFVADTNQRVDIVGVFDGFVYAAFLGSGGTEIWRSASGDTGTWTQVNSDGFDGDANNGRGIVDGATVYNGVLYFATLNTASGAEIWRTADGSTWTQVGGDGLDGTATNFAAELTHFNGHLYAWVTNYALGQAVYRSKCGICETQAVPATGTYTFAGVGSASPVLDVTGLTSPGDVAICTYPNAFPNDATTNKPIKRHFKVTTGGGIAGLVANLTLPYFSDDVYEFDPSDIASEGTTVLTRWDTGTSTWMDCPPGDQTRDTSANTATCANVSTFSPWGVAGAGGSPTAVRLLRLGAAPAVRFADSVRWNPAALAMVLVAGMLGLVMWWRKASRLQQFEGDLKG